MSLVKKTVEGAVWAFLTFGLGKFLLFITSVILARLLLPEEMGLAGLAMIGINYLGFVRDMGLGKALIYSDDDEVQTAANTSFYINLIIGLILFVVALFASPLVAQFFEEPDLVPMVNLLSVSFLINSVGATHDALLRKELAFKRKLIPDLTKTAVKGFTSIILALSGYGVWSLIWGQVASSLATTIATLIVFPWKPRLIFKGETGKELLKYGMQDVANYFLVLTGARVDFLLIGKIIGDVSLGIYTVAYKIPEIIILSIFAIIGRVLFPAYSKLKHDIAGLRKGFLLTLQYVTLASFPIGVGLFVTAPDLVSVIYTDKWIDAVPILRVLALFAMIRTIGWDVQSIYRATGRPEVVTRISLVKTIILFPAVLVGINQLGLVGAAYAQLIVAFIVTILNLWLAKNMLSIKITEYVKIIGKSGLAALFMYGGIQFLLMYSIHLSAFLRLTYTILVGGIIYSIFTYLFNPQMVRALYALVRNRAVQAGETSSL